jgi:hypothetical protein
VSIERKAASLKVSGERRAGADLLFIDQVDRDEDACAPGTFPEGRVPLHRGHEPFFQGAGAPFGIADIKNRGARYTADIEYLDTPRGREEYATAKALYAAGVTMPVSVAFTVEATGPVPPGLKAKRYITRGRFIVAGSGRTGHFESGGNSVPREHGDRAGVVPCDRAISPRRVFGIQLERKLPRYQRDNLLSVHTHGVTKVHEARRGVGESARDPRENNDMIVVRGIQL